MKMEVELIPMKIPNFVLQKMPPRPKEEGITDGPKFALKELDPQVLSELCDRFRADIFMKAEKQDPKESN